MTDLDLSLKWVISEADLLHLMSVKIGAPYVSVQDASKRTSIAVEPLATSIAAPVLPAPPIALAEMQIEAITYDEYAKRQDHESDFDCILKVVKRCLGVVSEPRNVEDLTRAEFEMHLRVCFQHDNVRARERGRDAPLNGLTADQEREIAERVELNYPSLGTFACPICGKAEPHQHSGDEIAKHRGAADKSSPAVPSNSKENRT